LNYPNTYDQIPFATAQQAADLGAVGVGATIYFGSPESGSPDPRDIGQAFAEAHQLGHVHGPVVLPAQPRL
jgi:class I fructose-bisphosphate aldolase